MWLDWCAACVKDRERCCSAAVLSATTRQQIERKVTGTEEDKEETSSLRQTKRCAICRASRMAVRTGSFLRANPKRRCFTTAVCQEVPFSGVRCVTCPALSESGGAG